MASLESTEQNLPLFHSQSWDLILPQGASKIFNFNPLFSLIIYEENSYVPRFQVQHHILDSANSTLNLHQLHMHHGSLIPVNYVPKNKLELGQWLNLGPISHLEC